MTLALNRQHPGDCLLGMQQLPAGCVDLVFADLPYGKTRNAWDRPIPLAALWPALLRVGHRGTVYVFTAMQPFASELVLSQPRLFRHDMVWRKNRPTGFLNARRRPLLAHESLLIFCAVQPAYAPRMRTDCPPMHAYTKRRGDGSNYGATTPGRAGGGRTDRYPTTVLEIPVVSNVGQERRHPTQKPEDLPGWFVSAYTKPGALVLDPTAGGGSTLLAAQKLGRRCVGFELDPRLCSAVNRDLAALEAA